MSGRALREGNRKEGALKGIISKAYGKKRIFDGLGFAFDEDEITCVLGPSGVGKTTLLRILAGLETYEGQIENAPKKCAFVFQESRLLPYLTVEENLRYVGCAEERIEDALKDAEIFPLKTQKAGTLSGGEKQRVALARAFAVEADTLLLDEPFSSLDTPLKIKMWKVFAKLWQAKKRTVVFVTHDIEEAWALAHRVVYIKNGEIAYDCRVERSAFPAEYGEYSAQKQAFVNALLTEAVDEK
ncbi:MAG: ABC transporter ATP-binding protein [Clostridiales bacterium]|nr:ABC transporter ATP-binding protein [Clostridiales bacterium]